MNTNYEIIKLIWFNKGQDAAFVSFYIIPKDKSADFFANPESLKLSIDAVEVYCTLQSEYLKNQVLHNTRIRQVVKFLSVRFEDVGLQPKKKNPREIITVIQGKSISAPTSPRAGAPILYRKNSRGCNSEPCSPRRSPELNTTPINPIALNLEPAMAETPPRLTRRPSMEYSPAKRNKLSFKDSI